jgi:hypothetical protein
VNRGEAYAALNRFIRSASSGDHQKELLDALLIVGSQPPLPGLDTFDTMAGGKTVKLAEETKG